MALGQLDVSEGPMDIITSQATLQAPVHSHGLGYRGVFVPEPANCPLVP